MSNSFDARSYEPLSAASGERKLAPTGLHRVKVTQADFKATSKGDGKGVAVVFELTEGEGAGAEVKAFFNVENKNAQAAAIGRRQLSGLCFAIAEGLTSEKAKNAVLTIKNMNFTSLLNKELVIEVTHETPTAKWKDKEGNVRDPVTQAKAARWLPVSASTETNISASYENLLSRDADDEGPELGVRDDEDGEEPDWAS